MNTRGLDLLVAAVGLPLTTPLMLLISLIIFFQSGSPIFRQERVGQHKIPFVLLKFRTMRRDTQSVATHLVNPMLVTTFGAVLRRTKLDELPQLWNVLKGDMSLVGPRPCLPNQFDVVAARDRWGVFAARPGITGLAQIRGIDMSQPELLAQTDAEMLRSFGWLTYFRLIWLTLVGRGGGDRIRKDLS